MLHGAGEINEPKMVRNQQTKIKSVLRSRNSFLINQFDCAGNLMQKFIQKWVKNITKI